MGQKTDWTTEQQIAIEKSGVDLLVAAAAGSGKTAVLVERIIRKIIDNQEDIDKLLVLTFTNAAASEMRERIGAALTRELEERPDDDHLKKQVTLINRSKITTIHAFCLEVVRENSVLIDLDPSFRIADEAETSLMKAELIGELFEELYTLDDNGFFLALVESYGENTGDQKLRRLILTIHEFVQSSPFPDLWIKSMTDAYALQHLENLDETVWGNMLLVEASFILEGLLSAEKQAMGLVDAYGVAEYAEAIANDLIFLEELKAACTSGIDAIYTTLKAKDFGNLGRKKKGTDATAAESIKALREEAKAGVKRLREKFFFKPSSELLADMKQLSPIINSLGYIVKLFSERYQAEKKDKMLVDFGDLEHYCLQILLEEGSTPEHPIPSPIAVQLQNQFQEVLCDEYQDSNLVQETILSVVSKAAQGKNNRFMVGDVKQSIYRFRLAKPELFMEKYNSFSIAGQGASQRIDLFQNFRSRETVLEGINFLFKQLMTKEVGEMTYDEKAALHPGAFFPKAPVGAFYGGPVELCLIDMSKPDEYTEEEANGYLEEVDDTLYEISELTNMEVEAANVAQKIKGMVQEQFQVLDKATKVYRNVQYGDFVILLRSHSKNGPILEETLKNADIPAYAESAAGFFDTIEIMTVLNLLRIIDNPRQDIPLLSILRSPIVGLSSNELLKIRLFGGTKEFYDCVTLYCEEGEDQVLREILSAFMERLNQWRNIAVDKPIDELLWLLYRETGYFDYVGVIPGGNIRQANLRILLDRAVQYESTSFKGLFHFIRYVERIRKNETDLGTAKVFGELENTVQILSIHKSKGLEFPIVIVAGLGKRFNKSELRNDVLLHQDLGFGTKYIDYENRVTYDTIGRTALSIQLERESLSEEMRVLYVALTRAKEKLILSGGVKGLGRALRRWTTYANETDWELPRYPIAKANTFLDWIVPALARHRDGKPLWEWAGLEPVFCSEIYQDPSRFQIELKTRMELFSSEEEEEIIEEEQKSELFWEYENEEDYSGFRNSIYERLSFIYSYSNAALLPANVSISELKRRYQEEDKEDFTQKMTGSFILPDFTKDEKGLSAAEKGTAVHTVMEHLNFRTQYQKEELELEISRLVELQIISKEAAASINRWKIIRFFQTALGKRLQNADEIRKEIPFALSLPASDIYREEAAGAEEEEILVHGIIDCYFKEKGKIILLDYKTDFVQEGGEADFANQYELQLSLYKRAIEQITNLSVNEVYLYSFWLDKEIFLPL